MLDKDIVKLNIILLPPENVIKEAINLSKEFSNIGNSDFVLSAKENIPHITMYQTEFPTKNLQKVIEVTKHISKELNPIELNFEDFSIEKDYGIWVNFYLSDDLQNLHTQVLELIDPLRDGHIRTKFSTESFLKEHNKKEQEIANKYSSPYVAKNFRPHITLGGFKEKKAREDCLKKAKWNIETFNVNTFAVAYSGPKGVCKEIIEKFDFR